MRKLFLRVNVVPIVTENDVDILGGRGDPCEFVCDVDEIFECPVFERQGFAGFVIRCCFCSVHWCLVKR